MKAFPGPRGRPDLKNAPPKDPARLPRSSAMGPVCIVRSMFAGWSSDYPGGSRHVAGAPCCKRHPRGLQETPRRPRSYPRGPWRHIKPHRANIKPYTNNIKPHKTNIKPYTNHIKPYKTLYEPSRRCPRSFPEATRRRPGSLGLRSCSQNPLAPVSWVRWQVLNTKGIWLARLAKGSSNLDSQI